MKAAFFSSLTPKSLQILKILLWKPFETNRSQTYGGLSFYSYEWMRACTFVFNNSFLPLPTAQHVRWGCPHIKSGLCAQTIDIIWGSVVNTNEVKLSHRVTHPREPIVLLDLVASETKFCPHATQTWREGHVVYECTCHPFNIQNLTPRDLLPIHLKYLGVD